MLYICCHNNRDNFCSIDDNSIFVSGILKKSQRWRYLISPPIMPRDASFSDSKCRVFVPAGCV